jgi:hypothetical protein
MITIAHNIGKIIKPTLLLQCSEQSYNILFNASFYRGYKDFLC